MKVIIDEKAGFCPGVIHAINIVEKRLNDGKSITGICGTAMVW